MATIRKQGKQTFELPREDTNAFTPIRKFLIDQGNHKKLIGLQSWADAFTDDPQLRAKAIKHQAWFRGNEVRITEINLQFNRFHLKCSMAASVTEADIARAGGAVCSLTQLRYFLPAAQILRSMRID
jgi:hypothetical protein